MMTHGRFFCLCCPDVVAFLAFPCGWTGTAAGAYNDKLSGFVFGSASTMESFCARTFWLSSSDSVLMYGSRLTDPVRLAQYTPGRGEPTSLGIGIFPNSKISSIIFPTVIVLEKNMLLPFRSKWPAIQIIFSITLSGMTGAFRLAMG